MSAVAAAVIGGVATITGGVIAASGAKKAANVQADAAREAQAAQERMFEKQVSLQEPFREAGLTAKDEIMRLLGIGGDANAADYGSLAKPFGMDQFNADPGYAFRQKEGMQALQRSAAARGGLLSGSTLKGIERFGQELASTEYTNAFNRYQIERNARLNPLQALMGSGQSSTNVLTNAANQAGQNEANNIYNAGVARASGYTGAANAMGSALSGIGSMAMQLPMYNAQINYLNNYNRSPGNGSSPYTPFTGY